MSAQDFGANDWLVDEMYEHYLADPSSVDPTWVEYFKNNKPGTPSSTAPSNDQSSQIVSKGVPPVPKSQQVRAQEIAAVVPPAPSAPAPVQQPIVKDIASLQPTPADPIVKPAPVLATPSASTLEPIRGVSARVVQSMEASLSVPTATSVRAVAAKLLIDNRIVINNHLKRARGGKTSFTHIIAYAMIKAVRTMPEMNAFFGEIDGKPAIGHPEHINLGIAIDLAKADGSRQLLVPSVKGCESMDFAAFWSAYEAIIKKARGGSLTVDDFAGTTLSITNPGTIGTVHSVPRLVQGQGLILGVGALDYPAEFHGASDETLARMAISKVVTLTSTYDHRVIQGAQSGDFLRRMNEYLLGADGFYDEIFASLRIPYEPIRWAKDFEFSKDEQINKTARIQQLIHAYRTFGHLMADVDPLEYKQRSHPDLDVVTHGLTLWDLDREFATGGFGGKTFMSLRKILGLLRDSYCRTVGVEYMYIEDRAERQWIQTQVEVGAQKFAPEEHLRILHKLNGAEAFETFLQTKFVGQKRFSLEGGESVIPLLDAVLSSAADQGLVEVCIGMPHRGRLNVLANIAGKSHGQIFQEFQGHYAENQVQGSGDVKYHLGTEGFFTSHAGATTKIYLAANPSHLEAVNPVLEGIVRAKQDRLNIKHAYSVLPVLLHGDASFAGQGVNAEVLQMSQLAGYRTGGTIHIVVNNQVGFTTSPHASRTSTYSTDFAKIIQAPVFHVNGDDPEACVRIARLAFEYRQKFNKDVVIDMVCYRRRGHNEGDEPSFTQPLMYKMIDAKRSTRTLYIEALIGRGDISLDEADEVARDYQSQLEAVYAAVNNIHTESDPNFKAPVAPDAHEIVTSISESLAREIAATQTAIPEGFNVHPKLLPQLAKRVESLNDDSIDWSTGEMLAFGSLLKEDRPIRLAGQDSRRGTFSNRHAVIIDRENGNEWTPLRALNSDENHFFVIDSLLSEYAAMGFEYGYSAEREDALVLWEGQFGDFANGAQTIIDEFISSALQKWGERSSVVLLLPHGYEGQGPDHSSARIERYLQLCAEQNMTVAQPSTPASYFHLLRWHALNPTRRPLIVFTPKSMLRLRAAASSLSDFTSGHFRPVISDETVQNATRLIFCSGKIYHDLVAERAKTGESTTAIVRLELLYPLPIDEMIAEADKHPNANLLWVQDEPANQGPWTHVALRTSEKHGGRGFGSRILRRVSRRAAASPATGNHHLHEDEQKALMLEAFTR
ncbi:MAG: multifunctional oxoglutarate decarboxylase/oxoglutarate dehydrogenase thiamine pyrophosphate-binding subunit/dihydrolipoyllysine-residue succinyltransferase subunit [Streptomycetaceae bacterium]|nr:MAG: multifunctional oxoglutarate decarboxylase/oxoglutarate dehydrogenase thiamine pyrophosphate-binding subunit/dihydrolipoyllysine-residue succinyltransferase subunit [Streptomycetaceae bacterium]